ncbi:phosphatase PAP2 family protein [Pseudoalteromonas sp. C2R02]|uniref:phosphatase PAP2 family protein n=1 Tax=Pseudoalteromonas sp. C2R02 TaxID=2841565 RepID=UPI001C096E4E|nr:phosphatase PAP2 family protein [Pseudoalteromonas sp. C2R02]MBU2971632.1 phosphatase PAP2 family protein [Pseudoalteromonas sp. C2R02]
MNNVVSIALLTVFVSFTSYIFDFTWLELGANLSDFSWVINLTSGSGSLMVIACLALVLTGLYTQNKKHYFKTLARFLCFILILIVCVLSLKSSVEVKRPFQVLLSEQSMSCSKVEAVKCVKPINIANWQKSHWENESRFSLPSGHAAFTFFITTFFSLLLYKNGYKILTLGLFSWAVLVSYSRLLIGMHWPLDILIGAVMGIVFGYLSFIPSNFKLRP